MQDSGLSNSTLRAWSRLAQAHRQIEGGIERALKSAGLPPLACHGVLDVLLETPGRRLRPAEVEKATGITQYTLSRLLDRMDAQKLVHRIPCAEDGRGQWLVPGIDGEAICAKMQTIVAQALKTHIEDKLQGDPAKKLAKLLGRILSQ